MAYDLLYRRHIKKNVALHALAEEPQATEDVVLDDAEKAMIAKLAVIKANAESGNKRALADWQKVRRNLVVAGKRARQGDPKARRYLTAIKASGLINDKIVSMTMGADTSAREKKIVAAMANLKAKADKGDADAKRVVAAIKAALG